MQVAQIIDTLHWGGAQKMQIMLARAMQGRNVKLTVVSLRRNVDGTPIPGELQALGARVLYYPARRFFDFELLWKMSRFLRRERFDLVHTHLSYANTMGVVAGRLAGIPTVASLRSAGIDMRFYHPVRHRLETWALRYGARRVMAVGQAVAEAHQARLNGKPIDPIPNAVDIIPPLEPAERLRLRAELTGDPCRPLLISVGRLTPAKGYHDLLAAFADLRRTHPSAALIIAGKGDLRQELEGRIGELGLKGQAVLLGAREDVPRLLAASDIFVSSSHWEGLPVAVLEAMSAGLPVVATGVGDVPHVVVDGTGLVVPAKEPAALAAAVRSLLDDPARMAACGTAAQAHVSRNHSLTAWADRLLSLYEGCMK